MISKFIRKTHLYGEVYEVTELDPLDVMRERERQRREDAADAFFEKIHAMSLKAQKRIDALYESYQLKQSKPAFDKSYQQLLNESMNRLAPGHLYGNAISNLFQMSRLNEFSNNPAYQQNHHETWLGNRFSL